MLLTAPHRVTAYSSAAGCIYGSSAGFGCSLCSLCSCGVLTRKLVFHILSMGLYVTAKHSDWSLCWQVSAKFNAGDGLQTNYDWLVVFRSSMGSNFFGVGCAATFVLGNNPDYAQQLAAREAHGQQGKKPRSVLHPHCLVT